MMEFFNFGSDESYELFLWLTQHRASSLKEQIDLAADDIEVGPKQALALAIEEFVCENIAAAGHADFGCGVVADLVPGDTLAASLLRCALSRIDFDRVAEALLRKAGKWSDES